MARGTWVIALLVVALVTSGCRLLSLGPTTPTVALDRTYMCEIASRFDVAEDPQDSWFPSMEDPRPWELGALGQLVIAVGTGDPSRSRLVDVGRELVSSTKLIDVAKARDSVTIVQASCLDRVVPSPGPSLGPGIEPSNVALDRAYACEIAARFDPTQTSHDHWFPGVDDPRTWEIWALAALLRAVGAGDPSSAELSTLGERVAGSYDRGNIPILTAAMTDIQASCATP